MTIVNKPRMLLCALLLACALPAAAQQDYPNRSIRIILPFSPGAGTDLLARLLSQRFYANWGHTVTVDNRTGAGGNIGADLVAKSAPDGYTLLMTTASVTVNVTLYPKMPYNLQKDLAPITLVGSAPIVVVVHPSVPVRTIQDLVALAKARKDGLNYGSNGTGTTSHLAGELLKQVSKAQLTHIPYKGASAAMTALLSGEVEMGFPSTTSARPLISARKVRGLAVTTRQRSSVLPDLPTVDSLYPGFDVDNWFGLWAPAGTPPAIIAKIQAEVVKSLPHPDLKNYMQREGAEPVGNTSAEFAAFITREIEKFARIVKASGAKPEL
jgi:tripartite-type tricarboxylate transporter receptor subunit TctC